MYIYIYIYFKLCYKVYCKNADDQKVEEIFYNNLFVDFFYANN